MTYVEDEKPPSKEANIYIERPQQDANETHERADAAHSKKV